MLVTKQLISHFYYHQYKKNVHINVYIQAVTKDQRICCNSSSKVEIMTAPLGTRSPVLPSNNITVPILRSNAVPTLSAYRCKRTKFYLFRSFISLVVVKYFMLYVFGCQASIFLSRFLCGCWMNTVGNYECECDCLINWGLEADCMGLDIGYSFSLSNVSIQLFQSLLARLMTDPYDPKSNPV